MIADKFKVDVKEGCISAIYAALAALEERIDALQPPQPTPDTGKREWNNGGYYYVWRAFKHKDEWVVDKVKMSCLDGIYWMPYIPGEPAPEAPKEVK